MLLLYYCCRIAGAAAIAAEAGATTTSYYYIYVTTATRTAAVFQKERGGTHTTSALIVSVTLTLRVNARKLLSTAVCVPGITDGESEAHASHTAHTSHIVHIRTSAGLCFGWGVFLNTMLLLFVVRSVPHIPGIIHQCNRRPFSQSLPGAWCRCAAEVH